MNPRTPKRALQDAAEKTVLNTLREVVHGCEWCQRRIGTEPHHVARGSDRGEAIGDVRLILLLCRDCHRTIERLAGDDQRAIGLALLRFAGRMDLEAFYTATNRRWPEASLVELWCKRLLRV